MDLAVFDPFPRLETTRLVLCQITSVDHEALMSVFGDPQVTITTDVDVFTRPEEAIELIEALDRRYRNKQGLRWGIVLKAENKLIGTGGFNYFEPNSQRCEIGYDLARAYWNKGLVTEAVGAIIDFGFNRIGVNRIEATTNLHNVASMKVLYKLGFREEGILRQYGFWRGQYHDLRLHALLKRDFKSSK